MPNWSIEPNPDLNITLAYEDADLLVAIKPPRMVSNPGKGHERGTMLNALFHTHGPRLQNIGREKDFGLLHRLDRETSGLLIVALTKSAYDALRIQFETRTVKKFYWALVRDIPDPPKGVIDRPIREQEDRTSKYTARKVASVTRAKRRQGSAGPPKDAVTAFRVVSAGRGPNGEAALLECRPVTGRLHQIRVHMALIGHPVLGDGDYADEGKSAPRVALHAHRLSFTHPVTGQPIDVRSPFPPDLKPTLRKYKLQVPESGATEADP